MNFISHLGDISLKHPMLDFEPRRDDSLADTVSGSWMPGSIQNNFSTGNFQDKINSISGRPSQELPGSRRRLPNDQ